VRQARSGINFPENFQCRIIALKMEAARTSETSVVIQLTRQYIPEDSELHTRRRENLKSHIEYFCLYLLNVLRDGTYIQEHRDRSLIVITVGTWGSGFSL
jgi:hypothetical protein